jgi:hypothetical protein
MSGPSVLESGLSDTEWDNVCSFLLSWDHPEGLEGSSSSSLPSCAGTHGTDDGMASSPSTCMSSVTVQASPPRQTLLCMPLDGACKPLSALSLGEMRLMTDQGISLPASIEDAEESSDPVVASCCVCSDKGTYPARHGREEQELLVMYACCSQYCHFECLAKWVACRSERSRHCPCCGGGELPAAFVETACTRAKENKAKARQWQGHLLSDQDEKL